MRWSFSLSSRLVTSFEMLYFVLRADFISEWSVSDSARCVTSSSLMSVDYCRLSFASIFRVHNSAINLITKLSTARHLLICLNFCALFFSTSRWEGSWDGQKIISTPRFKSQLIENKLLRLFCWAPTRLSLWYLILFDSRVSASICLVSARRLHFQLQLGLLCAIEWHFTIVFSNCKWLVIG